MQLKQSILEAVIAELRKAKRKFPNWPQHPAAQAGIVCEEAGELMQAALQFKYENSKRTNVEHIANARKEAVQVIVTAIRFLEHLENDWADNKPPISSQINSNHE
jgi:NTP pyrophosphatase (non-canonical NTP hydrolase)